MDREKTNRAECYWDPYDEALFADPYPAYAALRRDAPVFHNEAYDFWAISRHADVEAALKDWKTFSSDRGDILEIIQSGIDLPGGVVMFEDPPLHAMHRGVMSRVFTPRRMAGLEGQVREFTARCLDPLVGQGGFDFMADLGEIVPMRVIGMLLGIPDSDLLTVREHTENTLRTKRGEPMQVTPDNIASGELFAEYIEWRAEHPSDDLMTQLLTAEFEDEDGEIRTLTRNEAMTYSQVLAGAGNETTGKLIGWVGKVLADHPDQRRELVEDRSLIPAAIEEVLRFEPTGHAIARYVARDFEHEDGTVIPAGSAAMVLIASANRDERRHGHPDRFDIHRAQGAHHTFGFGLHFCLGAALARMEARVVVDELLDRFPEWDIDMDNAVLASTSTMRGWETLPATTT